MAFADNQDSISQHAKIIMFSSQLFGIFNESMKY